MYRSFILGIPKIITSNVTAYYIPLFSFRQSYRIYKFISSSLKKWNSIRIEVYGEQKTFFRNKEIVYVDFVSFISF